MYFGSVFCIFKMCVRFIVILIVCMSMTMSNNDFPCVQTKFGKYTIFGENTPFLSLEYPNKKFGVGRSVREVDRGVFV